MRQVYEVTQRELDRATRIKHYSSDGVTAICGIIRKPPRLAPALTTSAMQCSCNGCLLVLAKNTEGAA